MYLYRVRFFVVVCLQCLEVRHEGRGVVAQALKLMVCVITVCVVQIVISMYMWAPEGGTIARAI